jgi:hypothetical protein
MPKKRDTQEMSQNVGLQLRITLCNSPEVLKLLYLFNLGSCAIRLNWQQICQRPELQTQDNTTRTQYGFAVE